MRLVSVYISFQAVVVAHIYASWTGRLEKHTALTKQTTHQSNYFFLGKLRIPVGICALIYGVVMIINILWPRPVDEIGGWLTLISTVAVLAVGLAVARGRDEEVSMLSASFHFDERSYLLDEAFLSKEAQNLRATLRRPLSFSRPIASQIE